MEDLKRLISEEDYNELVKELTDLIIQNKNVDKMYVIDTMQVLINRKTNYFMLFNACEEVYDNIKNNIC